ncbi:MAG: ParA family protein [Desulfarculaceae bacterium]|jgi:chromosome partitioning protein
MDQKTELGGASSGSRRMRRIVVSLLKGGVAKSETAVNLAHGLALAGYRVLLVDTDVQSHCAEMLGVHPEKGLAELIAGWTDPDGALAEARDNLWLLAGGTNLAAVKMEIARREMAPEAVLAEALDCFEGRFDFLVMDTAPGWDTLLVNALYFSKEVLAPVSMEPMAIKGLQTFQERLSVIQKYNQGLTLRWILPTFVDGRVKKTGEILSQLRERYGDLVVSPVKYSVKLSEATAFGKTIFEHDPRGSGAKAYGELAHRVIDDGEVSDSTQDAPIAAEPLHISQPLEPEPLPVPSYVPEIEQEPYQSLVTEPEPFEAQPEPTPTETQVEDADSQSPTQSQASSQAPVLDMRQKLIERLRKDGAARKLLRERLKKKDDPARPVIEKTIREMRERLRDERP